MVPSMIQLPEQPGIEVTGFAVDQLDEVVRFNVEVCCATKIITIRYII